MNDLDLYALLTEYIAIQEELERLRQLAAVARLDIISEMNRRDVSRVSIRGITAKTTYKYNSISLSVKGD